MKKILTIIICLLTIMSCDADPSVEVTFQEAMEGNGYWESDDGITSLSFDKAGPTMYIFWETSDGSVAPDLQELKVWINKDSTNETVNGFLLTVDYSSGTPVLEDEENATITEENVFIMKNDLTSYSRQYLEFSYIENGETITIENNDLKSFVE